MGDRVRRMAGEWARDAGTVPAPRSAAWAVRCAAFPRVPRGTVWGVCPPGGRERDISIRGLGVIASDCSRAGVFSRPVRPPRRDGAPGATGRLQPSVAIWPRRGMRWRRRGMDKRRGGVTELVREDGAPGALARPSARTSRPGAAGSRASTWTLGRRGRPHHGPLASPCPSRRTCSLAVVLEASTRWLAVGVGARPC